MGRKTGGAGRGEGSDVQAPPEAVLRVRPFDPARCRVEGPEPWNAVHLRRLRERGEQDPGVRAALHEPSEEAPLVCVGEGGEALRVREAGALFADKSCDFGGGEAEK